MTDGFFDVLETRDPEVRQAALEVALPRQIAHAKAGAPGFAEILKDVDPEAVTSRAALSGLPVTRKSELMERQSASPPLGGLAAGIPARLFASPGPVYELETLRTGGEFKIDRQPSRLFLFLMTHYHSLRFGQFSPRPTVAVTPGYER